MIELIHENDSISFDGYTITIEGQHGHTFSFDVSIVNILTGSTLAMAETRQEVRRMETKQTKEIVDGDEELPITEMSSPTLWTL